MEKGDGEVVIVAVGNAGVLAAVAALLAVPGESPRWPKMAPETPQTPQDDFQYCSRQNNSSQLPTCLQ